jgi:hypothetical protein
MGWKAMLRGPKSPYKNPPLYNGVPSRQRYDDSITRHIDGEGVIV